VLDHVGFDVKNLEEFAKKLQAAGIALDRPIVTQPNGGKLTFIHDPWGTSIELNERPHSAELIISAVHNGRHPVIAGLSMSRCFANHRCNDHWIIRFRG